PERVHIIPDGILGYLPFDLLLYEAGDGDSYLTRRHQLTYTYAPGFLPGLSNVPPAARAKGVLAMAPHFGTATDTLSDSLWLAQRTALQPLRYNEREASAIHALWGGALQTGVAASKEAFLQEASTYSLIHIASHAAVNDQEPGFSYVAFSPEADSQAYQLYLNEIFDLDLRADLVVLSACETGIGTFYQGEGMASLARGFSVAGARAVLTTLWKVDDAGSMRFMETFYRHLQEQPDAATALHQTRLDFIEAGEHPYIWGAYLPSGDWAGVSPGTSSGSGLVPGIWVALLAGLIAIGIWRWQRHKQI
ncbi:MAG: CHAT domain-containing protein, partial [Bacteroidota bacterium]